ncbi:MAG: type II secretion system protein GspM [Oceanobacter sp.]
MSQLDEYRDKLINHPQILAANQWYSALSSRDQLVVRVVGWAVIAALVFLLIFAPLIKANQQHERSVAKRQQVYNLIAENAHRFGGASGTIAEGPILPLVSGKAQKHGLKLDRYEMDGKGVRVWLDAVAFDQFIAWAEELQSKHTIRVSQITVDATDSLGRVDVRVTYMPSGA